MKCPKCGGQAKYVEQRRKVGGQKPKPRTNFDAICMKCKFKFDAREYYDVVSVVGKKEEKQHTQIKMKYTEEDK